jgi:hypothetical protein
MPKRRWATRRLLAAESVVLGAHQAVSGCEAQAAEELGVARHLIYQIIYIATT